MKHQPQTYYAHSRNRDGRRHDLLTHLREVAARAATFAAPFGASELAYHLGLWHDLGKFNPAFQEYLLAAEQNPDQYRRGPDHKAAGVRIALEQGLGPLALLLHGHHGGLQNKETLRVWYSKHQAETKAQLALANRKAQLLPTQTLDLPPYAQPCQSHDLLQLEFFLRFLFSALVDADFLDTEAHFRAERVAQREAHIEMTELWACFERNQQELTTKNSPINQMRQAIYQASLEAAALSPGIFSLTAPTGGGKTRSALAFALHHAARCGHKRIITCLPYTTITSQTAQVYRDIFGAIEGQPIVLEHHSSAQAFDTWSRLAAENWDAPVIVTTTVQLFESLFANRPSRCRKVHRLSGSVIILDEVQTLPPHLLEPILSALKTLCANYGSTVLLCTATRPTFGAIPAFADTYTTEIVPPSLISQIPPRVTYEWRTNTPLTWPQIAEELRTQEQVLVILNTRRDALALLQALDDPNALYLSTYLCGAHRQQVIREVKRRLQTGEPCRLIATQVVEAGVDLDFPIVWRALGPLDSIIQAAGRCNREGLRVDGRVIIFQPTSGNLPRGAYERATATTITLTKAGQLDLEDSSIIRRYFRLLYPLEKSDTKEIQIARHRLDFPEVARRFRMIEEVTESVVIPYGSSRKNVQSMLDKLREGVPHARHLLRRLQPYLISLDSWQIEAAHKQELLTSVIPGINEWLGPYDQVSGLAPYLSRKDPS